MTAVEPVLQQLTRVRRRRVAYSLQGILYALVAASAASAGAVMALALVAGPSLFLGGAACAALLLMLAGALGVRAAWRAAASWRRIAFWVDEKAVLQGRLTTLVEIADRRPVPNLLPLLVQENADGLATWSPERLIPRAVPAGLFMAALGALAIVSLLLAFAPRLAPRPVEVALTDRPVVQGAPGVSTNDRLVLAPTAEADDAIHPPTTATAARGRDDGTPARPSLQERIRRRLLGSAWDRTHEATAASGRTGAPPGAPSGSERSPGSGSAGRLARSSGRERREASPERTGGTDGEAGGSDATPGRTGSQPAGTNGGAAPGAGTGTSPDLYGPRTARHRGGDPFELSLDAPGQGDLPAPRPPSGETPPAGEDQRPQLAAHQRPEAAVPRMAVPVAYEAVVRALFAHPEVPR